MQASTLLLVAPGIAAGGESGVENVAACLALEGRLSSSPVGRPITVIGRGEAGLLVQTGDGVHEPQNRRVEIVIQ